MRRRPELPSDAIPDDGTLPAFMNETGKTPAMIAMRRPPRDLVPTYPPDFRSSVQP